MTGPADPPRPPRLVSSDMHTTNIPETVFKQALHLLVSGTMAERRQAAQLLANAYAEDEARRQAAEE